MKVKRGQINLYVGDVERSVRFYTRILGFREVDDPMAVDAEEDWAKVACDDLVITLYPSREVVPLPPVGRQPGMTADLYTDDIDSALSRLKDSGVEVSDMQHHAGWRKLKFRDPDGIGWELVQPKKGETMIKDAPK